MHHRKAVDKHRYIIAILTLARINGILVDDLQEIVVYILLVDKRDIFACAVVTAERFDVVFLNCASLFDNTLICVCEILVKKAFPFSVCKGIAVKTLYLKAEIFYQIGFLVYRQILISQFTEASDKVLFKLRFTLVAVRRSRFGDIFRYYGIFICCGDDVVVHCLNISKNLSGIIAGISLFSKSFILRVTI